MIRAIIPFHVLIDANVELAMWNFEVLVQEKLRRYMTLTLPFTQLSLTVNMHFGGSIGGKKEEVSDVPFSKANAVRSALSYCIDCLLLPAKRIDVISVLKPFGSLPWPSSNARTNVSPISWAAVNIGRLR